MPFRFDEQDPRFLIVYTGDDHNISDYQEFLRRWTGRFDHDERFGVIMVNEPHDHDDEDAERHAEEEAKLIKLINDFRRDYRQRANAVTIGFANVYDPDAEWLQEKTEAEWEQFQQHAERNANYMWGTYGRNFTKLDSAKAWLREQAALPPLNINTQIASVGDGSSRIGLFYGSTSGVTEQIALNIQAMWAQAGLGDLPVVNISQLDDLKSLETFDNLILGCPTWNIGCLQDDWDIEFPNLAFVSLEGKRIALFGAGDQQHYAENFQDALGILGRGLREQGVTLVGFTSTDGYDYEASVGVENGQFMGLAIDEINQPDLTDERIEKWVRQLVHEFEIVPEPQE